jgi:DNA polymerase III subunit beta
VRISCDRESLARALGTVSRIATSRGGIRILECVRLGSDSGNNSLTLAATDTELSCRRSVAVEALEPGVVVVPARSLFEIVRAIGGDTVTLAHDPATGILRVTDGLSDYKLNTHDSVDFPALPIYAGGVEIELDRPLFIAAAARVVGAASTDASRPVYTGVHMSIGRGEITVAATDGYRLATTTTALRTSGEPTEALIPARALQELSRLNAADDSLRVTLTPNLIAFEQRDVVLTSRRLDGKPQSHEHLLAAPFTHHATLARRELLAAVNRAAVIVNRGSPIELSFTAEELHLRVRTPELGEANECVELLAPGPTMRIGFNPQYLRDGLELVEGDEVGFKMNDGLGPVVLHGQQADFAYLLAPRRLPE